MCRKSPFDLDGSQQSMCSVCGLVVEHWIWYLGQPMYVAHVLEQGTQDKLLSTS